MIFAKNRANFALPVHKNRIIYDFLSDFGKYAIFPKTINHSEKIKVISLIGNRKKQLLENVGVFLLMIEELLQKLTRL